jgi:hypothetical protein
MATRRPPGSARRRLACIIGATTVFVACVRPPFQQEIAEGRWADAKATFESDSSLMNNESALIEAAKLYGSPTRGAYDPGRARLLLQRLLARNPQSKYRVEAEDRLALLEGAIRERDSLSGERRALDDRITQLTNEMRRLRGSLDSANARNDTLQRTVTRMEMDLRDRDEQLRALRVELARLKQIDLNPRPTARPPQR